MSKTLTNKQYYENVIKPQHKPSVIGVVTENRISCSCGKVEDYKDYVEHIVTILNKEFNFFDERYGITSFYDGR